MIQFQHSLPMLLNVTLHQVMPIYRELFAAYDLTDQQWRVLRVLWADGSATMSEISAQTLLPKPSLVGILDRLESRGLIQRERSAKDRRSNRITTTPKGKTLSQEVLPKAEAIHTHILNSVSRADWDHLEKTLADLQSFTKTVTLHDILHAAENQ